MIPVPAEFKELTLQFQLASLAYHGSLEAMITSALSKVGDQGREVIEDFLSELLSGKYDSGTIHTVWDSTSADFFIQGDENLISFLKLIQERVHEA